MKRFAVLVCFVIQAIAYGQEVTDLDLERASAGRTVRVRIGSNGAAPRVDLPVELYVARVLAGEGEPRAGAAAQQALAIAIRTFAAANAGRHRRDGFDLCDATHCQVLRVPTQASRLAALTTASQLLTYEGRPATVFYSASCGGRSEEASEVWAGAGNLPYLRSFEDEVHGPEDAWVLDLPLARVERTLRRMGFEGKLRGIEVERRSASGRVTLLGLSGMRPDVITGEDFRAAIGARDLRSTQFTVRKDGGVVRFTGQGYGHGVGLCVIGAGRRATRGETATDILGWYYPGLRIEPAPGAMQLPVAAVSTNGDPSSETTRLHQLAQRARGELSTTLRIAAPPEVRLEIHPSLEAFRSATGRPWWLAFAVTGSVIELAPPAVLQQSQDGLDASVRRAVAEVLIAETLADHPAWMRVGVARYYATAQRADLSIDRVRCPSDAELMMPVSAAAHRDAELRAEACVARAIAKARDWRNVR